MKRIGTAICPDCGLIDILDIDDVTIYIGKGLAMPTAQIRCTKCRTPFTCAVTWESAWLFDRIGCCVVGFSRRTATAITAEEIKGFMLSFDGQLDEFLDIIDSESF